MKMRTAGRATLIATLLLSGAAAFTEDLPTAAEWIEDLEYWEGKIREIHIAPFHTLPEAEFNEQIADVKRRIPELTAGEIALEFARLAGLIADGHTWVSPHQHPYLTRYPIALYPFSDGLFVTLAMEPYTHLRGTKLTSIAGADPMTVLESAKKHVGHDNEWTQLARSPGLLTRPEFLKKEGLIDQAGPATFEFEKADGTRITETLPSLPLDALNDWAKEQPKPKNPPLAYRQPEKNYWLEPLREHRTVFAKFNSVQNQEGGPHLPGFAKRMMEMVDDTDAEYLIIDARDNGGGDGSLLKPLVRRIAKNETINRRGHLYVITSRYTFSAALMFTARMERQTEALFVGEPGSGKPNSYSEFNEIFLPNSNLRGSISSIFHQEGEPGDTREAIPVDIPVKRTGSDYFNDRDPVLEATLKTIAQNRGVRAAD